MLPPALLLALQVLLGAPRVPLWMLGRGLWWWSIWGWRMLWRVGIGCRGMISRICGRWRGWGW
ncbi:hypothetical protein J2W20_000523 [Sinomonas atrocyanea]|nr:hypothetical protein [Sinomonas atrocyanea]